MSNQAAMEAILVSAYAEEAAVYTSTLHSAEHLLGEIEQGRAGDAELQAVVARLAQINEIEGRIAEVKASWRNLDCKPGPELSQALVQVADLIQKLMSHLQTVEHHAGGRQRNMIRDLENVVRGQNMKKAYETAFALAVVAPVR